MPSVSSGSIEKVKKIKKYESVNNEKTNRKPVRKITKKIAYLKF